MEKISSINDFEKLLYNNIFYDDASIQVEKSEISFVGKNNFLIVEKGAIITNSKIRFKGSNSIVYIRKTRNNKVNLSLDIYNDSVFFMDLGCSVNINLRVIISENKNVIVGKDCMFSHGCWIRNSDAHIIYDNNDNRRINHSKDIIIGSHVWIGQDARIMKSSHVGSGTVIGMSSLVTYRLQCNSIYSGNPCVLKKENIFWDRTPKHLFNKNKTKDSEYYIGDEKGSYYFDDNDNTELWSKKLAEISELPANDAKILKIKELSELPDLIVNNPYKKSTIKNHIQNFLHKLPF